MKKQLVQAAQIALLLALTTPVFAQFAMPDQGKLLATGGVNDIEGVGGGGLSPWALISGYGTQDSYGANVHSTLLYTSDYRISSEGVNVGVLDRVEVSLANLRIEGTGSGLNGVAIREDIAGVKVRVLGNAVYDQDSWLPQVAIGAEFRQNHGITGLEGLGVHQATDLGAKHNDSTDFYLAATKLFLEQSVLANITLRASDANQFGLLGAGGPRGNSDKVNFEGSLAYLFTRKLAAGIEYRDKPRNLAIDDERAAYDAFIAYFPNRNVSVTLAYVSLGTIVKPFVPGNQSGPYLSVQVGF